MPRLNPKIILYGIEEHRTNEEVIANIKAQNGDLEKSTITLDFIMNTEKGKNVIISTDPKTFQKIIRKTIEQWMVSNRCKGVYQAKAMFKMI